MSLNKDFQIAIFLNHIFAKCYPNPTTLPNLILKEYSLIYPQKCVPTFSWKTLLILFLFFCRVTVIQRPLTHFICLPVELVSHFCARHIWFNWHYVISTPYKPLQLAVILVSLCTVWLFNCMFCFAFVMFDCR